MSLYASIRGKNADWVNQSLRMGRGHAADQLGVWTEMAARDGVHRVASPTAAIQDFYLRFEEELTAARKALAPVPGQLGALVYLKSQWVGLDLLPGPRLFASAWPRLGAGYAAAALSQKPSNQPLPPAASILAILGAGPAEPAPAVGLGEEHRLVGQVLIGAVLIACESLVHFMAFPRYPIVDMEPGGRSG